MTTANADQNLLFGFIALQNGLLSREDLIAATSVWLQDKSQSLDQILLDRDLLTEDAHQLLQSLVSLHLSKHDGDAEMSLAAIDALSSVREELQRLGDEDVEASLVQVGQMRDGREEVTRTIAWGPSSPDTRYQVLRPHAKGGLGLVSVARDEELKREVAFKEIQEKYAHDESSRARFLREAEVTGGLEHPGIVPVYGLGQYDDGRPYYAMRLVKGKNLRDAIKDYHKAADQVSSERSLEFRQLLGHFIDVCNTIEYAHSRGILHRDIKPANVMLGKYGETLVVDWGLAKSIGRSDEHRSTGEETLQPISGNDSSQTRMGSAIGTPSYMSPEQAAGKLDHLGPNSDVFSLGATLYCILTGQPPQHESDADTAIRKTQSGEFPRPSEVKPGIPAPLEAICLKAMALRTADRYHSAATLRTDVERWLADDTVTAHQESLSERTARFARRHRSWVQAGLVAALLVAVSSIAAAVFINSARKQEAAQRRVAVTALANADKQRQIAEARGEELEQQLRVSAVTRLAAQAQAISEKLPVRSLLLAIAAVETSWEHDSSVMRIAREALLTNVSNVGGVPLNGHTGRIWSMAISGDGRKLATIGGSGDTTARVWDLFAEDPASSPVVLRGHTSGLWSVAMSQDGRWLVTGSYDQTARLWELSAVDPGSTSIVLSGHTDWVTSVAVSPDGRWVATGSRDRTARLWDLRAEDPSSSSIVLAGHSEPLAISSIAFSPDSLRLVTGSLDHTARLWDLAAADLASSSLVLEGHTDEISAVAVSPNGRWVATASEDATARLWDLAMETPEYSSIVLGGHRRSVTSLAFSNDSRLLVTGSADRTAQLWDLDAEDPPTSGRRLGGHEGSIRAVAISASGRWLATGSGDGTCHLWDLAVADLETASPLVLRGHEHTVESIAICPRNRWLVTGGWDNSVRLWDLTSENPASPVLLQGFDSSVNSVSMSFDSQLLVTNTVNDEGGVVWDLSAGRTAAARLLQNGYRSDTDSVAMDAEGRCLLTTTLNESALLWDLVADGPPQFSLVLPEGEHRIHEVAVSPERRWLVATKHDGTALLWEISAPTARPRELEGYQWTGRGERSLAISPNGQWLVTTTKDHALLLWDLSLDDPTAAPTELVGHEGAIYSLAISPDSRWLVTGSQDRTARRWDLNATDPAGSSVTLVGHRVSISSIAISSDSRRLVTGSWDGTARVWDLDAKDPSPSSIVLTGHTTALSRVAISPDNRWLVTTDGIGIARLWDFSGEGPPSTSLVLRGHDGGIWSVAFSPDNRWLVTGSSDRTVRLWDLELQSLLDRARRLTGRELTPEEQKEYLLVAP